MDEISLSEKVGVHTSIGRLDLALDVVREANSPDLSDVDTAFGFLFLNRMGLYAEAIRSWYRLEALTHPTVANYTLHSLAQLGDIEIIDTPRFIAFFATLPEDPHVRWGQIRLFSMAAAARPDGPFFETVFKKVILKNVRSLPPDAVRLATRAALGVYPAGTVIQAITAAAGTTPNHMPRWLMESFVRHQPQLMKALLDQTDTTAEAPLYQEQSIIPYLSAGLYREVLTPPASQDRQFDGVLTKDAMKKVVADIAADAKELASSDQDIAAYLAQLRPLLSQDPPLYQVVSTGRAGTKSLNDLLARTGRYQPYHYLDSNMETGDKMRLLYGYWMGDTHRKDCLRKVMLRLLQDRGLEIAYAHKIGRIPVIVNHMDAVFAPIYPVLFEGTETIHMYREDSKTLASLAYKSQFGYRQIRRLSVAAQAKPSPANLVFWHGDPLSIEEECLWYIRWTAYWFEALEALDNGPATHTIDIASVFKTPSTAASVLRPIFPEIKFSDELLERHYSQVINDKKHLAASSELMEKSRVEALIAKLDDDGSYLKQISS